MPDPQHTFFVAGIGTDVGKTVVSAILAEALQATYWKPVQAGDLHWSDSLKVRSFCSGKVIVLPERYRLNTPASPHLAAQIDGISIEASDFEIPSVEGNLLIEGAGGLMVPLNSEGLLYIDVLKSWKIPAILVSRHYLGSINHTLLSLELLKNEGIELHALVFTGTPNEASESIILKRFPVSRVIRIPQAETVDAAFVRSEAQRVAEILNQH